MPTAASSAKATDDTHGVIVHTGVAADPSELRRVVLQGVVSGFAFSQMNAWQVFADACLSKLSIDQDETDVFATFVRAMSFTFFTMSATCVVLRCFTRR